METTEESATHGTERGSVCATKHKIDNHMSAVHMNQFRVPNSLSP
jgi:hypothetical protein